MNLIQFNSNIITIDIYLYSTFIFKTVGFVIKIIVKNFLSDL
jgi:hypothetical protein